jgi:HK97 family phage major capsid protein
MASIEELAKDIAERQATIAKNTEPAAIQKIIADYFDKLDDNDPIVRKMRFGKSDDALIGSKFARYDLGAADIEFLSDWMLAKQRAFGGQGPSEELTGAMKAVSDAFYLPEEDVRRIDRTAMENAFPRVPRTKRLEQHISMQKRAMDSAETGFGLQLIGAQYVRDLWEAARTEQRVANLIDTFEMTDPTAYIPVEVDVPEPILVTESTANNSSNYGTVKTGSQRVQVDAKKLIWHQMWSGELEEDSIIPFVPFLRRQMALGLAYYTDSLVLNGDTTNAGTGNINLDDADPADTKYYLAFDGIRHAALVDNTANALDAAAGAVDLAKLNNLRGLMLDAARFHDWGHPTNPNDLVYVADPTTADKVALLDDIVNAKIQMGNNANLLSGQVASIVGHPVISSPMVSKTEADGKVSTTGGNNTLGQIVLFNTRGFKIGWRRRVRVEMESLIGSDQRRAVYSVRLGFGRYSPTGAASGIESAAVLYNISLA